MSCKDCDEFQDNQDRHYYYRWGAANIEIVACEKHIKEIFEALNEFQRGKE